MLDETVTLIKARLGHRHTVQFSDSLRASQVCTTVHVSADDEDAAWHIFKQYHDKAWSFTDCVSMAVMQRMEIATAFALDERYSQMGFALVPSAVDRDMVYGVE